jgi:hypothetical protein
MVTPQHILQHIDRDYLGEQIYELMLDTITTLLHVYFSISFSGSS